MKSKYATPVEIKELDELLEFNQNEVIWEQRVNSEKAIQNFIMQLFIAGFCLLIFHDVFNILLCIILIIPYGIAVYMSTTMKYSIFPNRIKFEWGLFSRKKVSILFKNITAINLVKYEESNLSTIYFGTKNKVKVKKIDFNSSESRAHITFENIKDGDKVNELVSQMLRG